MMLRVFICSPFRNKDFEKRIANVDLAWRMMDMALREGFAPFAPHLLYPHSLNDDVEGEREKAIAAGLEWLAVCDEVWIPHGVPVTDGMQEELKIAKQLRKKIIERTVNVVPF